MSEQISEHQYRKTLIFSKIYNELSIIAQFYNENWIPQKVKFLKLEKGCLAQATNCDGIDSTDFENLIFELEDNTPIFINSFEIKLAKGNVIIFHSKPPHN